MEDQPEPTPTSQIRVAGCSRLFQAGMKVMKVMKVMAGVGRNASFWLHPSGFTLAVEVVEELSQSAEFDPFELAARTQLLTNGLPTQVRSDESSLNTSNYKQLMFTKFTTCLEAQAFRNGLSAADVFLLPCPS